MLIMIYTLKLPFLIHVLRDNVQKVNQVRKQKIGVVHV